MHRNLRPLAILEATTNTDDLAFSDGLLDEGDVAGTGILVVGEVFAEGAH